MQSKLSTGDRHMLQYPRDYKHIISDKTCGREISTLR